MLVLIFIEHMVVTNLAMLFACANFYCAHAGENLTVYILVTNLTVYIVVNIGKQLWSCWD